MLLPTSLGFVQIHRLLFFISFISLPCVDYCFVLCLSFHVQISIHILTFPQYVTFLGLMVSIIDNRFWVKVSWLFHGLQHQPQIRDCPIIPECKGSAQTTPIDTSCYSYFTDHLPSSVSIANFGLDFLSLRSTI